MNEGRVSAKPFCFDELKIEAICFDSVKTNAPIKSGRAMPERVPGA
ncbi:hypothetical protein [Burkholderia pseudomallei]|nr:hypothetical protein [Burkholderia pseudomallei]